MSHPPNPRELLRQHSDERYLKPRGIYSDDNSDTPLRSAPSTASISSSSWIKSPTIATRSSTFGGVRILGEARKYAGKACSPLLAPSLSATEKVQSFLTKPDRPVHDIPDPKDSDPERYAVLAVLTEMLMIAFNYLIEHGLARDAPAIVLDWEEMRSSPKVFEKMPLWAVNMKPLERRLRLPDRDGDLPLSEDVASRIFLKKNILKIEPHFYFV